MSRKLALALAQAQASHARTVRSPNYWVDVAFKDTLP